MPRTFTCSHVIPPHWTDARPDTPSVVCGMPVGHLNRGVPHGGWTTSWPRHRAPGPSQIGNQSLTAPPARHKSEPWPDYGEALAAAYELSDHFTRVARQETTR